jgi:hypothetical protein
MEKLQSMATALAASIPPHLGQPTIPPISWAQNDDFVTVILADGRKVAASIQEINLLMFKQKIVAEPAHPDFDSLEVDLHQNMVKPAASARKRKAKK